RAAHQLRGQHRQAIVPIFCPPIQNFDILPLDVARFAEASEECRSKNPCSTHCAEGEIPDRLQRPLRPRRQRPSRHGTEPRDEFAPSHSITSSARTRNVSGMVTPIALAVFVLMTNSNLVENWTGSSLGFAPRRIRST